MNSKPSHFSEGVSPTEAASLGVSRRAMAAVDWRPRAGPGLRLVSSTAAPRGLAASSPAVFTTVSDQIPRRRAARIASSAIPGGRVYLCDPDAHAINVLDQNYRPIFSFGGFGSGLGQLDTPTGIVVVWIEAVDPAAPTGDSALLVVADRGNHRIQLFEPDGASIGAIGGDAGLAVSGRWPARAGWPFFCLDCVPPLPFPSRLEWRPPYLDVTCGGSMAVRVDLPAALLPDFNTWIAEASPTVLRQAFHRFTAHPERADIPDSCLREIVERLLPAPCPLRLLSQRGRG